MTETDCEKLIDTLRRWLERSIADRLRLIDRLILRLEDNTKVGLTNNCGMVIWYRVETGEMELAGHGGRTNQDLYTVGGKAAWAIHGLMDFQYLLPEINEGLGKEERVRRAAAIRVYVPAYREVSEFIAGDDYPVLAKAVSRWKALPAERKAATAELLASHIKSYGPERPVKNNTELRIEPRNPRPADIDTKQDPFKKSTHHDIHVPSGRAAWALEELTGLSMPWQTDPRLAKDDDDKASDERAQKESVSNRVIMFYATGLRQGAAAPPSAVPEGKP